MSLFTFKHICVIIIINQHKGDIYENNKWKGYSIRP